MFVIHTQVRRVFMISWCINSPNSKVLSHLEHIKTHIGFLQETNLKNSDQVRIRKKWIGQVFHSNILSKSRGVEIIINWCVQFSPSQTLADSGRRYVIVFGLL